MNDPSDGTRLRPAVFFDRDGVVNPPPPDRYVRRAEDFHLSDGIARAVRLCRERGYLTVLVTSQQGVGLGLMTEGDLDAVHARMQALLAEHGAAFDDIRVCPHVDGTCDCRKPSPKMVLDAARALGIDLPRSLLAGDSDRDIVMGRNAGVGTLVRILPAGNPAPAPEAAADFTVESPAALVAVLDRLTASAGGRGKG